LGHHADQRLQTLWHRHGAEAFEWSIHMLLPTDVIDDQYRVRVRMLLFALQHKDLQSALTINEPERLLAYASHHQSHLVNYYADNSTYQDYHYSHMRDLLKVPRTIRGRLSGVYSFERHEPAEIYIGESVDIGVRWRDHIRGFLDGTHHNAQATASWSTTSPKQWKFKVLEVCSENRLAREAEWIERYRARGNYAILNHS
jgi:hypothetical protein